MHVSHISPREVSYAGVSGALLGLPSSLWYLLQASCQEVAPCRHLHQGFPDTSTFHHDQIVLLFPRCNISTSPACVASRMSTPSCMPFVSLRRPQSWWLRQSHTELRSCQTAATDASVQTLICCLKPRIRPSFTVCPYHQSTLLLDFTQQVHCDATFRKACIDVLKVQASVHVPILERHFALEYSWQLHDTSNPRRCRYESPYGSYRCL